MPELKCSATPSTVSLNLTDFIEDCKPEYNEFKINKKRIYAKHGDSYIEEWFQCYEVIGDHFINGLYSYRQKLANGEIDDVNICTIIDEIFAPYYAAALDYCDKNYNVDIVIGTDNVELQFDRTHCLVILTAAKIDRCIIPLITEYVKDVNKDNDYINTVFLDVFITCIQNIQKLVPNRCINIENKLRKLIESRIFGTEYSDSVIWGYLKNIGSSSVESVQPLLRKVFIDIIPKLSLEQNCINFLHVVIKHQIHYLFHAKIPMQYETVNSSIEPDEASVFDMEVSKLNQNEIYGPLITLGIEDMIRRVKNSIGKDIQIDNAELEKYTPLLKPSKEKNILYFIVYGKFIEEHEILYMVNQKVFAVLMMYLHKIFIKFGFTELAKIILSEPYESELTMAKFKLTKKYITAIKESERYKILKSERFSNIITKFDGSNIILTLLENCLRSSRKALDSEAEVTLDPETLADELIKLIGFIS